MDFLANLQQEIWHSKQSIFKYYVGISVQNVNIIVYYGDIKQLNW